MDSNQNHTVIDLMLEYSDTNLRPHLEQWIQKI